EKVRKSTLSDFHENTCIFLMPRIIDPLFHINQPVQINPVRRSFPIKRALPFLPGFIKFHSLNRSDQINPVRRNAELDNFLFLPGLKQKRTSKLPQSPIRPQNVGRQSINPEINVFCVPRLGVVNKCQPADNEISRFVSLKKNQQIFKIPYGVHQ
ncbi:MAG: hypothetical protein KKD33_04360, partial [Verrucomicrobia bacterium]|nr:hypothetical protein [Verrucomicrobiota bacterium]